MTAVVTLRPARAGDAEAVCTIYNQGIEDRVATLEIELRTPEERREWMAARGPHHPVIAAESEGILVGWGSLNVFNPRPAYKHVADFSVYVERAWRGKGVGHRLLERLIEIAREIGYHKMVLSTFPTGGGRAPLRAPGLQPRRRLPRAGYARRPVGGHAHHGEAALVPARARARART